MNDQCAVKRCFKRPRFVIWRSDEDLYSKVCLIHLKPTIKKLKRKGIKGKYARIEFLTEIGKFIEEESLLKTVDF